MRNVIFAINITLDGCCDHTKQISDDETHEYFTQLMREVDLLIFGRKTYQLMVPFWPEVAKNRVSSPPAHSVLKPPSGKSVNKPSGSWILWSGGDPDDPRPKRKAF
jgi:hypothetical protein